MLILVDKECFLFLVGLESDVVIIEMLLLL
jgi:hypothetical protein